MQSELPPFPPSAPGGPWRPGREERRKKREERRERIRQSWERHYGELLLGERTLGEILGYDDERLMKLADRGLRLFELGKHRAALKVFRGLVILDPWVPYFRYLLGSVQEKLGDLYAAEAEFQKAVEMTEGLDPPPDLLGYSLLARGRVLARMKRTPEALVPLRRLCEGGAGAACDPVVQNSGRLILEHLQSERPSSG